MCGYAGFVYTSKSIHTSQPNLQHTFMQSAQCITHRGNEPVRSIFLENLLAAHSRLAFLDLSSAGNQPMWDVQKEWILIFNGEIYNYLFLRSKIIAEFNYPFQSYSDTEVILAGFLCYQERILSLLEGEFSFVIFKANGSEFFAARDPFGVKPLYAWCENVSTVQFALAQKEYEFFSPALCFSSEIKGIFCDKKWDKEGFLRQAIGLFEPIRTQFQNIIHVPQGSFLWGKKHEEKNEFHVRIVLEEQAIRQAPFVSYQNTAQIYHDFNDYLEESVFERTISDVELGVYLSGGIDSKTIAAYLARLTKKKNNKFNSRTHLKSFTVGFDVEEGFDESVDALRFAEAAGFDAKLLRVNDKDLQYAYPIALYHSEIVQPYTNGAAKWWLSLFTAQYVKGVLTGDGADELLGGYPSFRYAAWWKFILRNRPEGSIFDQIKHHPLGKSWRDHVYQRKFYEHSQNPWLSGTSHEGTGADFIESLELWGVPHPLFGQIKAIASLLLGNEAYLWLTKQRESISSWFKFGFHENDQFYTNAENVLLLWQNYFSKTHLPVHVLNWVGDRMEMANTLEGRPPFLSKKLKKFIHHLGDNFLVRGFEEKSILKRNFKMQFSQYDAFYPREKKQFNAPLLFHSNWTFHKERILEKFKESDLIDNVQIEHLLKNKDILQDTNFMQNYLNITLQTLISFTYIDDYIVEKQPLVRDLNYEHAKIKH